MDRRRLSKNARWLSKPPPPRRVAEQSERLFQAVAIFELADEETVTPAGDGTAGRAAPTDRAKNVVRLAKEKSAARARRVQRRAPGETASDECSSSKNQPPC